MTERTWYILIALFLGIVFMGYTAQAVCMLTFSYLWHLRRAEEKQWEAREGDTWDSFHNRLPSGSKMVIEESGVFHKFPAGFSFLTGGYYGTRRVSLETADFVLREMPKIVHAQIHEMHALGPVIGVRGCNKVYEWVERNGKRWSWAGWVEPSPGHMVVNEVVYK